MVKNIINNYILSTPKRRLFFVIYCALVYLFSIIPVSMYFSQVAASGVLPAEADSISIPIGAYGVMIIILFPLISAFIWFALQKYPGKVSFFVLNKQRPYWSAMWTIIFSILLISFIGFGILEIQQSYYWGFYYFLTVPIFLTLRASLVLSDWFAKDKELFIVVLILIIFPIVFWTLR